MDIYESIYSKVVKQYEKGGFQCWNCCLAQYKCVCKELLTYNKVLTVFNQTKKRRLSEGRSIYYPNSLKEQEKVMEKTFQIDYDDKLSSVTKDILYTCQKKYIYYSLDDIMIIENIKERELLLSFIFSSLLSLHNNFSVNFFDVWIDQIAIKSIPKSNRFLKKNVQKYHTVIKLSLFYRTRLPIKKLEPLW